MGRTNFHIARHVVRIATIATTLAFGLVVALAVPAAADLVPSTGFRTLIASADGTTESLTDTSLDPLDESFSPTASAPGLICTLLEWSANAAQTSSITATGIDAVGSISFSTPPPECLQGSGTLAGSSTSFRFLVDEPHELILTGTSQTTHVRLAEFSGSIGEIYFERLATDPGGAISFSITVPSGSYSFLADADVSQTGGPTSAAYDLQLEVVEVAPAVPGLGVGAAVLLGVGVALTGVRQLRRRIAG